MKQTKKKIKETRMRDGNCGSMGNKTEREERIK